MYGQDDHPNQYKFSSFSFCDNPEPKLVPVKKTGAKKYFKPELPNNKDNQHHGQHNSIDGDGDGDIFIPPSKEPFL